MKIKWNFVDLEIKGWTLILVELWKFLVPILYLLAWVLILRIAKDLLGMGILDNNFFLSISLVILFMGIISRSTTWSVGGDKGIKGDSLGKYVEFHSGAKYPWDYKYYTEKPEEAIKKSEDQMQTINIKAFENEK